MHFRTIREAAVHYRAQDPDTAITEYRIRQLVVNGAVPSVRAGKKYLVALETLDDYFSHPTANTHKAAGRQVWQLR